MLRTSHFWKLFSLCLLAHASGASAQQSAPSSAPPKIERIEPASDIPATLPTKNTSGPQITEKRGNGGQATEVTVKSGGSTYTIKPNPQIGNAQPGDVQGGGAIRAPQWKVLEFDLGKKKQSEREAEAAAAEAAAAAPAPPPPPPPPQPKPQPVR
jgi:hypothetical protein